MPFFLIFLGAILIITAYRNTYGQLATDLEQDAAGFFPWALAIVAVGALQWIPGMTTIARWLLALVLVVIVLKNFTNVQKAVASLGTLPAPQTGSITPAQAYINNPANPQITQAEITGQVAGNANVNANATAMTSSPIGAFDPAAFLTAFEAGVGGFGGVA